MRFEQKTKRRPPHRTFSEFGLLTIENRRAPVVALLQQLRSNNHGRDLVPACSSDKDIIVRFAFAIEINRVEIPCALLGRVDGIRKSLAFNHRCRSVQPGYGEFLYRPPCTALSITTVRGKLPWLFKRPALGAPPKSIEESPVCLGRTHFHRLSRQLR